MSFPAKVTMVEVGPRDGLQNEAQIIPADVKIDFINRLSATGLPVIEATSFVSPSWIPQLADNQAVYAGILKSHAVRYPVLIPNRTGLNAALTFGVKEIAVFTTPSETFCQRNTNCSVAESLQRIQDVMTEAKEYRMRVRGYLSCVLGCPFEGEIKPAAVAALAQQLVQMGCDEISLGDTIGVGTPAKTQAMLAAVMAVVPVEKLAVHFHDTYGQALANIYVALQNGVSVIDSSVSGLGGCPYAKGATGNVASEDVLYMLNGMGIETGVDLEALAEAGRFISAYLKRPSQSKVNVALAGRN